MIDDGEVWRQDEIMYHYDPVTALEELNEEAVLPHPGHLRDMMVRMDVAPESAVKMNRSFQEYIQKFGELQSLVRPILEELSAARHK
jgi:hypothetical protein